MILAETLTNINAWSERWGAAYVAAGARHILGQSIGTRGQQPQLVVLKLQTFPVTTRRAPIVAVHVHGLPALYPQTRANYCGCVVHPAHWLVVQI